MAEWFRWFVEVLLLSYIVYAEHEALKVNKEVLRFYSEFISSRTRWYSSRIYSKIKKAPEEAVPQEPIAEIGYSTSLAVEDSQEPPEPDA